MNIPFYKCNSNGNDFIIILHSNNLNYNIFDKEMIRNICKYESDLSVDGFILLNNINLLYLMNYYNNDGSWETFCLNGLICCALILNKEYNKSFFEIISNDVKYKTEIIKNNFVKVQMNKPIYREKNIKIDNYSADYLDSGAKHLVINYKDNWEEYKKIEQKMRAIRYNKIFEPEGINVNLYKVIDSKSIHVKTYEKGIESIMDSCASGSFACAYDYSNKNKHIHKINVINDGGNSQVIFENKYSKNFFSSKGFIEFKGELKI